MFIRNLFKSSRAEKGSSLLTEEEVGEQHSSYQETYKLPASISVPLIEDDALMKSLFFPNQIFDKCDCPVEDTKPSVLGDIFCSVSPYSDDVLTFKDLDRKDMFLQKMKAIKCERTNRQIEMIAQDYVIKQRFQYRYFYRKREDNTKNSECLLNIAIGVMSVNPQFEKRILDYDPSDEGPFFQLVPLVGNRILSWNDCSLVTVGLRCKENVTTIIDLVKLVNQEQVTKVLEELADECCFWNGEKMFSYTSNNSFHFLKAIISRILTTLSKISSLNDEQKTISKKSLDEIIESKLTYSIKTYVREFVEAKGYSRAIIPLAHKVKPLSPEIIKQFGESYQSLPSNALTQPLLFTTEHQLDIYKKIVETNMSTYFVSEGMQEYRFWSCLKRSLSKDKQPGEDKGVLQIILKDKAFDLYDYTPQKPQR
ncbi:hypothetical protein FDP41_002859 [Naegleria fowleri]|uniref:Uncharacterized protein n=1 Tax=Naegleria fowleri TaxID=5763 RepID=A0A6A5BVP6_NAEFO|nr:uncharacterized protein FDP41_002859 [Naegleria fowleri]KAF0978344.1 hypothetical protein FDP41_002859 [Naegleria fowleri]CAG4717889.1 unnamed protein product [Naegleria fowleri]